MVILIFLHRLPPVKRSFNHFHTFFCKLCPEKNEFYSKKLLLGSIVEYSRNWGADKVSFLDDQQALSYLPARWTDRYPPDVFTVFSKGRAYFSLDALIELSAFIKTLKLARKDTADVK